MIYDIGPYIVDKVIILLTIIVFSLMNEEGDNRYHTRYFFSGFPTSYITYMSHLLIVFFIHDLICSLDEYWTFNLNVNTPVIDIIIVVVIMITVNMNFFNTIQICINFNLRDTIIEMTIFQCQTEVQTIRRPRRHTSSVCAMQHPRSLFSCVTQAIKFHRCVSKRSCLDTLMHFKDTFFPPRHHSRHRRHVGHYL